MQKKARKCIKKAGDCTNIKNQAGERISDILCQEHNYSKRDFQPVSLLNVLSHKCVNIEIERCLCICARNQ